jgi:hypothetical protein
MLDIKHTAEALLRQPPAESDAEVAKKEKCVLCDGVIRPQHRPCGVPMQNAHRDAYYSLAASNLRIMHKPLLAHTGVIKAATSG